MAQQLRIALVGKAGSGKDYFVEYLRSRGLNVLRAAYADALKTDISYLLRGLTTEDHYTLDDGTAWDWINERKHIPAIRSLLQAYGEAMVALYGEEYWAQRCEDTTYGWALYDGVTPLVFPDVVCITDCRKLAEADHARRDGFSIVRIVRTDGYQAAGITPENSQHRSETEQDRIKADYTIVNDGTAAFHHEIDEAVRWIEGAPF